MQQRNLTQDLEQLKKNSNAPSSLDILYGVATNIMVGEAQRRMSAINELESELGSVKSVKVAHEMLQNRQAQDIQGYKDFLTKQYRDNNGRLSPEQKAKNQQAKTDLIYKQQKLQQYENYWQEANNEFRNNPRKWDSKMAAIEWEKMQRDPYNYEIDKAKGFGQVGNPFLAYKMYNVPAELKTAQTAYRSLQQASSYTEKAEKDGKYVETGYNKYGDEGAYDYWFLSKFSDSPNFKDYYDVAFSTQSKEKQELYLQKAEQTRINPAVLAYMDGNEYKEIRKQAIIHNVGSRTTPSSSGGFVLNFGIGGKGGNIDQYARNKEIDGGHVYEEFIDFSPYPTKYRKLENFTPQGLVYELGKEQERTEVSPKIGDYEIVGFDNASGTMVVSTIEQDYQGNKRKKLYEMSLNDNIDILKNKIPMEGDIVATQERGSYFSPQQITEAEVEEMARKQVGKKPKDTRWNKDARTKWDNDFEEAKQAIRNSYKYNVVDSDEGEEKEKFNTGGLYTRHE